jgi:hypothetical protein
MKVTLKLLLCFLAASYVAGVLLLLVEPPNAHIPSLAVWAMSPVFPFFFVQEWVMGELRIKQGIFLVAFVLLFAGSAYWALRSGEELQ